MGKGSKVEKFIKQLPDARRNPNGKGKYINTCAFADTHQIKATQITQHERETGLCP